MATATAHTAVSPKRLSPAFFAGGAEILLAFVFLAGAVFKALDTEAWITQLAAYDLVGDPALLRAAALAVIGFESVLGMALLLGLRPRVVVWSVVLASLGAFTAIIGYGWLVHGVTDCGCFGSYVAWPPWVSILKNAALIALLSAAWRVSARANGAGGDGLLGERWQPVLLVLPPVLLITLAHFTAPAGVVVILDPKQPFAQFQVADDGQPHDLSEGVYIVAMLTPTCPACREAVPQLNELAAAEDLPPVVGLITGAPADIERFKDAYGPAFPVERMEPALFTQLIGGGVPRIYVVVDGLQSHQWDGVAPDRALLLEVAEFQ